MGRPGLWTHRVDVPRIDVSKLARAPTTMRGICTHCIERAALRNCNNLTLNHVDGLKNVHVKT